MTVMVNEFSCKILTVNDVKEVEMFRFHRHSVQWMYKLCTLLSKRYEEWY